jgi:hypothetical protein
VGIKVCERGGQSNTQYNSSTGVQYCTPHMWNSSAPNNGSGGRLTTLKELASLQDENFSVLKVDGFHGQMLG